MVGNGAARVAIVGAGVAGLTAAHTLVAADADLDVVVLEASTRAGGKLWAPSFMDHPVDAGADAFLARVPEAVELCKELGLDDELVKPAERRALLLFEGQLQPFPDGLVLGVPTDFNSLRASGLVGPTAIATAERDLENDEPALVEDESVGDYVRRHVGDVVFERLVGTLLSGINAGDPDQLSLFAGAPQLAAVAKAGGSLVRALGAQLAARDPDAPIFYSLSAGAGRLVEALAAELGERIRYACRVDALRRRDDGRYALGVTRPEDPDVVDVAADDGTARGDTTQVLDADAVILATPAFVTGPLLQPLAPDTAADLRSLEYASVAVVTVRLARAHVGYPIDASGYLSPPEEGLLTTACSFGSAKWPQWSDDDHLVLRFSVGRHGDERHLQMTDEELVGQVLREAEGPLQLGGAPDAVRVTRWPRSLPQYRPGHLDRVARWEDDLAERVPGVVLAGAALRGLGVPACVGSGKAAAARVRAALSR
jgi:oxygen-dependent protoporphyrinogen oxidase